jgi:hypothetical protein
MVYGYMTIFVFGNPDLEMDALPVRLIPALQKEFSDIAFVTLDPNEDWDVPKHMVIIDTVVGIETVMVFHDLSVFSKAPRMTCHDFDAYANLLLLKKIGKITGVTIIGVPVSAYEHLLPEVIDALKTASDGRIAPTTGS